VQSPGCPRARTSGRPVLENWGTPPAGLGQRALAVTMLQPRTIERKGAKQGAQRAAAAGLELERRPAVRARRMRIEKGGDLLLEEVSLEGAEKLFGLGQA
jgi:hypothetical protein